ncbi:hypothetical protein [Streptomyces flavalbus]|uniref:Uncharacterized protein n=1 Tax=Streptomyces flavalbus TaxID=2665155 RepID=A0ABW2W797_9ACTN
MRGPFVVALEGDHDRRLVAKPPGQRGGAVGPGQPEVDPETRCTARRWSRRQSASPSRGLLDAPPVDAAEARTGVLGRVLRPMGRARRPVGQDEEPRAVLLELAGGCAAVVLAPTCRKAPCGAW